MFYVAHTAFQRLMMRTVASVANVKIHAADTFVQMTRNVLSISHNTIHHSHQFAVKVRHTFSSKLNTVFKLQMNLLYYSK